jgi:hypothetical protein
MPLSRNRSLTKNQQRARKRLREFRQSIHAAFVAWVRGDITDEVRKQHRDYALRRLAGVKQREVQQ